MSIYHPLPSADDRSARLAADGLLDPCENLLTRGRCPSCESGSFDQSTGARTGECVVLLGDLATGDGEAVAARRAPEARAAPREVGHELLLVPVELVEREHGDV